MNVYGRITIHYIFKNDILNQFKKLGVANTWPVELGHQASVSVSFSRPECKSRSLVRFTCPHQPHTAVGGVGVVPTAAITKFIAPHC